MSRVEVIKLALTKKILLCYILDKSCNATSKRIPFFYTGSSYLSFYSNRFLLEVLKYRKIKYIVNNNVNPSVNGRVNHTPVKSKKEDKINNNGMTKINPLNNERINDCFGLATAEKNAIDTIFRPINKKAIK